MLCSFCFNSYLENGLCRGRLRLGRRAGSVGIAQCLGAGDDLRPLAYPSV